MAIYGEPLLTDLDMLDALYLIQLHDRGFAEADDVWMEIQARKAVNLDRVRGVRVAEQVLLA